MKISGTLQRHQNKVRASGHWKIYKRQPKQDRYKHWFYTPKWSTKWVNLLEFFLIGKTWFIYSQANLLTLSSCLVIKLTPGTFGCHKFFAIYIIIEWLKIVYDLEPNDPCKYQFKFFWNDESHQVWKCDKRKLGINIFFLQVLSVNI